MKPRFLFGVAAAMVSFALVTGVGLAENCSALSKPCPSWGAENPVVEGTCCTQVTSSHQPCGTGVMSVTSVAIVKCGLEYPIVDKACGTVSSGSCGGDSSAAGCTSGNCPSS